MGQEPSREGAAGDGEVGAQARKRHGYVGNVVGAVPGGTGLLRQCRLNGSSQARSVVVPLGNGHSVCGAIINHQGIVDVCLNRWEDLVRPQIVYAAPVPLSGSCMRKSQLLPATLSLESTKICLIY